MSSNRHILIKYSMYNTDSYILQRSTKSSTSLFFIENSNIFNNMYREDTVINDEDISGYINTKESLAWGNYNMLNNLEEELRRVYASITPADRKNEFKNSEGMNLTINPTIQDSNRLSIIEGSVDLGDKQITFIKLPARLKISNSQGLDKRFREKSEVFHREFKFAEITQKNLKVLEDEGFDFSWYRNKKDYRSVQSNEDFDRMVEHYKTELTKFQKGEYDRDEFIIAVDYEATGLEAFINGKTQTVFLGISFHDNISYGLFIGMEFFDNINLNYAAPRLTQMFGRNLLKENPEDDIRVIDGFEYKRSDIKVTAHNMSIDIRFGLMVGIDIWIDYCTQSLAFNFAPEIVRGSNGLKDRIEQLYGIVYPDIKDITGSYTAFKYIKDKETFMLYGCADVDLLRHYAYHLISVLRNAGKKFTGVDQVELFAKYDRDFNNILARMDYTGFRVNKEATKKLDENAKKRLFVLTDFLSKRLKMVSALKVMKMHKNQFKDTLVIPDPYKLEYTHYDKWSGDFLKQTLFGDFEVPVLVMTKRQPPKWDSKKKIFKSKEPEPALDSDALNVYLSYQNTQSFLEEVNETLSRDIKTMKDLTIHCNFLNEDVLDPVEPYDKDGNPNVFISKDEYNKYKYPVCYILKKIAPLQKDTSTDFSRILNSDGIVTEDSSTTRAATKRILNALQTVSSKNKSLFTPYYEGYYSFGADQSTVEVKIAQALSQDLNLISSAKDFESDAHRELAAIVFKKPPHEVTSYERKLVKFINFGRIYMRSVYSICLQIFGNNKQDSMAQTQKMINVFDEERKEIHRALGAVAAKLKTPVKEIPEDLHFLFNLDTRPFYISKKDESKIPRKFSFTKNIFGLTAFVELIDEMKNTTKSVINKGLNFAVQPTAANILRIIVKDLYITFLKEGWVQDESVMMHLLVHDEFQGCYNPKVVNPKKLIALTHKAMCINFDPYNKGDEYAVPLFIGAAIGTSWGDVKNDKNEIPVGLKLKWLEEVEQGMHQEAIPEVDHVQLVRDEIRQYKLDRVMSYLEKINDKKDIWIIEKVVNNFTNYTIRGYMYELVDPIFKPKHEDDPCENLNAILIPFLSKYMAKNKNHYYASNGKTLVITKSLYLNKYKSEEDLFSGKPVADDLDSISFVYKPEKIKEDVEEVSFNFLADEDEFNDNTKVIDLSEDITLEKVIYIIDEKGNRVQSSNVVNVREEEEEELNKPKHSFKIINNTITLKKRGNMKWVEDFIKDNPAGRRTNTVTITSTSPGLEKRTHGNLHVDLLPELEKRAKIAEELYSKKFSKLNKTSMFK